MRKTRLEKGITLIALIITIVVLLILAAVTIGTMKDSGIIGHAKNATDSYLVEQEKERIALAYSEYQIEKRLDPSKTLEIIGEDATTEQVGNYGWKVTYEKTGNVYGVNTKGEYDEAVTMIIEAVEEVSEIFDKVKTTNPNLNIDGISFEDFVIYEDKNAITKNAENTDTVLPEKYVFYNWNKLTTDEMMVIETKHNPELGTEKTYNLSNRLLNMDADGNGVVNKDDTDKLRSFSNSGGEVETIPLEKHNMLLQICIDKKNNNKSLHDLLLVDQNLNYDEISKAYYYDRDEDNECDEDEVVNLATGYGINFIFKKHFLGDNNTYDRYLRVFSGADKTAIELIVVSKTNTFYERYKDHFYYQSGRTDLL